MVLVHNFDPLGYYVGSSDARPDPMQPGEHLLPAFATFDPPPLPSAGQLVRFVQGVWKLEDAPQAPPEPFVMPQVAPHLGEAIDAGIVDRVRYARDRLLAASDWVVLRASEQGTPVPPDWLAYRQALRDVSSQEGFPDAVVWPGMPQ